MLVILCSNYFKNLIKNLIFAV